jgi:uncharacterized protein
VPVFPLPGTVLFPHTTLPLHVFELRYRTMVREALSGPRLIALAVLKPGWEQDYHGSPEFHSVGCLARFDEVEWLPNDCYDLKITGTTRVRFLRIAKEFPYRTAIVEALPQAPYSEDDPLVELERHAAAETLEKLLVAMGASPSQTRVDPTMRYETLVNTLCMGSDLPAEDRLELLDLDDVLERGRRIRELTERRLRGTAAVRAAKRSAPENEGDLN